MHMSQGKKKRLRPILAIASGGGHWKQLLCLRDAWDRLPVVYATVSEVYRADVDPAPFFVIPDGNIQTKIALFRMSIRLLSLALRVRPAVVISTGAAPGYFGLLFGKLLGARTVWIDSIANADELSLSGRRVGRFADVWLTQWEHLESPDGPHYEGSVI